MIAHILVDNPGSFQYNDWDFGIPTKKYSVIQLCQLHRFFQENMGDLVIGVDASTTACKAIVWGADGTSHGVGRADIPLLCPQPDWHEQSAHAWWDTLQIALRASLQGIRPDRLAGICISTQRETFVPVDPVGQSLYPAILWMDERAGSLIPMIKDNFSPADFHNITGKPLSANLTLSKILWLRKFMPQVFANTHMFLDVAAYLNYRLCGHFSTGWGIADPTGMFDMHQDRWSSEILDLIGISASQLPQAYPTGSVIGVVSQPAAENTGLPVGLPVVAGLGDGQAAGLGVNVAKTGETYLSLGTSVITGTYSQTYLIAEAFRTMYGIPGSYFLETVLLGGTYTINWLLNEFGGTKTLPELESAAGEIAPGCEGLYLVPYWNSVMNPYWDESASGIIIGWRGHHKLGHLYRAVLEGIAYELQLHVQGVESGTKIKINQLTAMGGGSTSDLWCQILADVIGIPVQRASTAEATSLGAGILASVGAGMFENTNCAADRMVSPGGRQFVPDSRVHNFYKNNYDQVYKHIYPSLRPIIRRTT